MQTPVKAALTFDIINNVCQGSLITKMGNGKHILYKMYLDVLFDKVQLIIMEEGCIFLCIAV